MIFPRVRRETRSGAVSVLPRLTLSAGEHTEKACRLLSLFLPQCPVSAADADATVTVSAFDLAPEAYRLSAENGRVRVLCASYAELRNALAALSLLVSFRDGALLLPDAEIDDAPALPHRGVMIDLARGVPDFDRLCGEMILAAKARMNVLHLHLSDSQGVCLELDSLPASCRLPRAYTKDQIRALCALADVLGLELVPEFDMPAHAGALLAALPALRCGAAEERSGYVLCAGREETYRLCEAVIREVAALFPGRYFHVGGDELEFGDRPELKQLCGWDECPACAAFRVRHALPDRQAQYGYFMRRACEAVRAAGRRPVLWSDQIDCKRPPALPKDVLLQFWRVAAAGRGPCEGCSLDAQLAMGYEAVNSCFPQAYADLEGYLNPEKLGAWHCRSDPAVDPARAGQIIGSEVCLWEYGNPAYAHYAATAPCAIALMADKLWNDDTFDYETCGAALTRLLLGAETPEGLDAFAAVGSVLPPRTGARVYPERVTCGEEKLRAILAALPDGSRFGAALAEACRQSIKNKGEMPDV